MIGIMKPSSRRALLAATGGALQFLLLWVGRARAHHGVALGFQDVTPPRWSASSPRRWSRLGLAVVVIAMLLTKKTPRSE